MPRRTGAGTSAFGPRSVIWRFGDFECIGLKSDAEAPVTGVSASDFGPPHLPSDVTVVAGVVTEAGGAVGSLFWASGDRSTRSTRRLCPRPSSVSLVSVGAWSAYPATA